MLDQLRPPEATAATDFVGAIAALDFDRLETILAPDIRFRALLPKTYEEAATAADARREIQRWFEDADRVEPLFVHADEVVDRLHLAYRLRIREGQQWYLAEQQAFGILDDARFTSLSLLCSGFRPIEEGATAGGPATTEGLAAATPGAAAREATAGAAAALGVATRLDAIGESCATLTPRIRTAIGGLASGDVLEVLANDPAAGPGLASWSRMTGNLLVATVPDDGGVVRYFLRRA